MKKCHMNQLHGKEEPADGPILEAERVKYERDHDEAYMDVIVVI